MRTGINGTKIVHGNGGTSVVYNPFLTQDGSGIDPEYKRTLLVGGGQDIALMFDTATCKEEGLPEVQKILKEAALREQYAQEDGETVGLMKRIDRADSQDKSWSSWRD